MCLFRPSAKLDAAFLVDVLNSSIGREQAARAAVGAAHPHINLGDIKSYSIPLPPLEEQRKLSKHLHECFEETEHLAHCYEQKLASLEALKKSLLDQAFAGKL
jgi:type I restriction enzyme S subunit